MLLKSNVMFSLCISVSWLGVLLFSFVAVFVIFAFIGFLVHHHHDVFILWYFCLWLTLTHFFCTTFLPLLLSLHLPNCSIFLSITCFKNHKIIFWFQAWISQNLLFSVYLFDILELSVVTCDKWRCPIKQLNTLTDFFLPLLIPTIPSYT